MGRHQKEIVIDNIDKRESGYYSTPDYIAKYIAKEMFDYKNDGKKLLDPAVGKEELLSVFIEKKIQIDSIDINKLKDKYNSNFQQKNFLDYYIEVKQNALFEYPELVYDYYIANPPYNCHEIDYINKNKNILIKYFGKGIISNMYSMFIYAMIDLAKKGAVIGFITYDSFLTSFYHKPLRDKIFNECSIHKLILCPTDVFWEQKADVRTCIMIIQKGREFQKKVSVQNRPKNKSHLEELLTKNHFNTKLLSEISLSTKIDNNEFLIDVPDDIISLFKNKRIGEIFPCVTGISTGNDNKYISSKPTADKRVPFYKNPGTRRFFQEPDGYIINNYLDECKKVKNFMVRNKDLLLKEGISCSSMGVSFNAVYLPKDAVFGVNANIIPEQSAIWWLLSYMNSNLVSYLVRGVLIRSNMVTSGYISRVPVINLSTNEKEELSKISKHIYQNKIVNGSIEKYLLDINSIIYKCTNLSTTSINIIEDFCNNILKRT